MKVALVHSFYSSAVPSGENATVMAQFAALRRGGFEVQIFERRTDDVAFRRGYAARAALTVASGHGPSPLGEILDYTPDVVHIHNLFPNWGSNWIAQCSVPVVATLHNYRAVCASGLLWRDGHDCTECLSRGSHRSVIHACYRGSRLQTIPLAVASRGSGASNPLLNRADGLVVLNSGAQSVFRSMVPSRTLLERIPNFAPNYPEKSGPTALRTRWLYAGRVTREKGVLLLARSWPEKAEPLDIVGDGPDFEALCRIADLKPNVNLLGQLPPSAVRAKMAESIGLLVPSLWSEGLPTVALEALAQGTPLVVSDSCAAADELVGGGTAGVIFSPSDGPLALSEALAAVRGSLGRLTRSARDHYETNFSEDRWLREIARFYSSVIRFRRSELSR